MIMNMLSFQSNKGFQDKCNCLESLEDYIQECGIPQEYRRLLYKSLEDYKQNRKLQDHEKSGRVGSQEVRNSQKVCKSQKVCQVSKSQNLKSLEDRQITRVKNQENNS
jgi:hypothetical protein